MIVALDDKYRFSHGLVEKNAIGEGVWDTISREASLSGRIESFDTTRKTRPKILSKLQAALYSNKLVLHDDDQLLDEMLAFYRNDSGKLEGKSHDDTVLSLAICWKAADPDGYAPASGTIIDEDGREIELEEEEEDGKEVKHWQDRVKEKEDQLESVGIV